MSQHSRTLHPLTGGLPGPGLSPLPSAAPPPRSWGGLGVLACQGTIGPQPLPAHCVRRSCRKETYLLADGPPAPDACPRDAWRPPCCSRGGVPYTRDLLLWVLSVTIDHPGLASRTGHEAFCTPSGKGTPAPLPKSLGFLSHLGVSSLRPGSSSPREGWPTE